MSAPAEPLIIRNKDILEVLAEIPDGHRHIRTTVRCRDGREFVFQEAAIANIVRAYTSITTHPQRTKVRLSGRAATKRKEGFAEWQLIEDDGD